MIQITAQMRVLVAIEPVDGRKGIDSLARLCQEKLTEDPFSGCVVSFRQACVGMPSDRLLAEINRPPNAVGRCVIAPEAAGDAGFNGSRAGVGGGWGTALV